MPDEILIDDIKFWVENNIIHCKIYSVFEENNSRDIEDIFSFAIKSLSNGSYLPILINMREMKVRQSYKAFKIISRSEVIKSLVLSKAFLVKTFSLKALLYIHNFKFNPIVLNSICRDHDSAIKECEKNYMMFNPINLK